MSKLTSKKFSSMRIFQLTSLSLALTLAGCGGPVDAIDPEPELGVTEKSDASGNGGNSKGKAGKGASDKEKQNAELKISDIKLTDAVSGEVTSSVTTDGAKATVIVTDKAGKPVENAMVTFSATGGVTFNSKNGAVLTNVKGEANIFLSPDDANDTSSYELSAEAKYKGSTATADEVYYSLQAVNIVLDELEVAENNLESGASTLVTLVTKNESTKKYKNNIKVGFSATCGSFTVADVTSSSQGNVKNTYKSINSNGELCQGEQAITVTSAGGVSKTTKVNIKKVEPNSIAYTSDEVKLGAKNSGASSSGKIEFTVFANGRPAANQEVKLELINSPPDFRFVSPDNKEKESTLKSDASGKVSVLLYPGNIPGPVEVKASLVNNPKVYALSRKVAVAVGLPIQDGITLEFGKNVLLDNKVDSTSLTAYLTDRQGNKLPRGTTVSFVSEGGTVTPNCSTDDEGKCKVTVRSQNPRPFNGRVSLLAYVEGEKTYVDMDGNNTFTQGDKFKSNIGEFFRDDNESLKYEEDNNEFVYRRPMQGSKKDCGKSTLIQPNIPGTCDDQLNTVLRQQAIIGFAHDKPILRRVKIGGGFLTFEMYGHEDETVSMPSGTSIKFGAEDNTPGNNGVCTPKLRDGYGIVPPDVKLKRVYTNLKNQEVVNTFRGSKVVRYAVELTKCSPPDVVTVRVTAPNKTITSMAFPVR